MRTARAAFYLARPTSAQRMGCTLSAAEVQAAAEYQAEGGSSISSDLRKSRNP
jgi:hypothetical protein